MNTPRHSMLKKVFPNGWASVLVAYVFVIFFIIGLAVHRDFGVSGDEPAVRKFGNDAFAYLFQKGPVPTEQDWKFFNPVVQIAMRGLEIALRLTDGADIWFMRHFVTFLLLFSTVAIFYRIARKRFGGWKLPLLGSVMFMVSPRVFAHGFYNPKDIPALFFFTLAAWTLCIFLERRTAWTLILHAICTALLVSTRTFGLLIPVLAMLFLWLSPHAEKRGVRRNLSISALYIAMLAVALFIVWPLLWHHPFSGVVGALINNSSRLGGGLYFGKAISAAGVPWSYLPVWIGITTPVAYSFFFLAGFAVLWTRVARRPIRFLKEQPVALIALLWFSLPVAALMILPIGIFNEWRHMLFLYPAFLLIALEGIAFLLTAAHKCPSAGRKIFPWIICGLLGLQICSTGAWMAVNHPFEYAYFSIPTSLVDGRFDLDYWGLSYRAGLEWILANDLHDSINVFVTERVGLAAADTIPLADWSRLHFVSADKADYILDTFASTGYRDTYPADREIHAITVDGLNILGIEKGPGLS